MRNQRSTWLALWLAASAVTTTTVLTGQVSVFLAVPATLAWWTARRGRWMAAGAWCGAVVGAKAFAAPVLIWLAIDPDRRRGLLPAAGTIGVSFALGAAWFGWDATLTWLAQLRQADWWWASINASVPGLVARCLVESPFSAPILDAPRAVAPIGYACIPPIVIATIWRARNADADRAFALLYLGSLLASPLGWIYYGWFAVGPCYSLIRDDRLPRGATWFALLALLVPPYVVSWPHHPLWTITVGSAYTYAFASLWWAAWSAREGDAGVGAAADPRRLARGSGAGHPPGAGTRVNGRG
jgi:hypothetical protein